MSLNSRLISILIDIQTGKYGKPTLGLSELCGEIHFYVENNIDNDLIFADHYETGSQSHPIDEATETMLNDIDQHHPMSGDMTHDYPISPYDYPDDMPSNQIP
jgi:hypothetical protein